MSPVQWNWRLLRAGAFRLDGGAMFGIIPRVLWSRVAPPDESNRIPLQTNCLLLDDGSRKVLIETGYGNKFDAKNRSIFALEDRWIVPALRKAGVEAEEIEAVFVTHLHFDHAGGLTSRREAASGGGGEGEGGGASGVPTFPNAKVYVQRREWLDALANKSTMSRTYLRDHLDPIADRVVLLDGECEPLDGIRVAPLPGHTWGQQGVIFEDVQGTIIFPGDVMPTIHHAMLPYNMAYDVLPFENMQTKRALLARCADEGRRIVIDHEPGAAVVRVERAAEKADGFILRPIERTGDRP